MKEKLTNNWGLKLIAVISAVLIWLLIMNNNDPVTTFTISGIPIEFLNEQSAITDNDMVYEVVGDRTVSVSVTTRTKDKDKVDAKDFRATVDLAEIYGVTGMVEIDVELVSDISLVRSWDQMTYGIRIATENIIDKTFPIEVVQEGEIEDGYVYRQCTLSSNYVTLTAPESDLARVDSVKAIVDVSQSSADEQLTVPLVFYNSAGSELNLGRMGIETDRTEVDVNVVVQRTSPVSIDVVVNNKDRVADGYRYITYRISEQSISVIGTKQAVAGLDKIQIELDAEGASGEVVREIDLMDYLPDNVSVAGDTTMVTVVLVIEPEGTHELEVSTRDVNLINEDYDLNYSIHQPNVMVSIFGLVSDWEGITADDIQLVLDVSNLDEGDHSLTLQAEPVEGLEITVPEEIVITITVKDTDEDDSTETGDVTGESETETGTSEAGTGAGAGSSGTVAGGSGAAGGESAGQSTQGSSAAGQSGRSR